MPLAWMFFSHRREYIFLVCLQYRIQKYFSFVDHREKIDCIISYYLAFSLAERHTYIVLYKNMYSTNVVSELMYSTYRLSSKMSLSKGSFRAI